MNSPVFSTPHTVAAAAVFSTPDAFAAVGGFYPGMAVNKTALIVEDDCASGLALKVLLERSRMNVVAARSGHTALDTLDQNEDIGNAATHSQRLQAATDKADAYRAHRHTRRLLDRQGVPDIDDHPAARDALAACPQAEMRCKSAAALAA
jgi:hypothetical protein